MTRLRHQFVENEQFRTDIRDPVCGVGGVKEIHRELRGSIEFERVLRVSYKVLSKIGDRAVE